MKIGENMKKTAILLAILSIVLIGNVSATGFSPSSLTFNLSPNQKQCQEIKVVSDSEGITVLDSWAKDKDVEWKFALFNDTASSKEISMDYPKSLSLTERTLDVCLSGRQIGEYHGIILLKEEQLGNSVVQMGVWLKVIISGSQNSQTTTPSLQQQTTITTNQFQEQPEVNQEGNTDNSSQQNTDGQDSLITGGVTGVIGSVSITGLILLIIVIILLTLIAFRKKISEEIKWRKYKWQNNW